MFKEVMTLAGMKDLWGPEVHFENMKGTVQQNVEYTGKEATLEDGTLHEFGVRPLTNKERNTKTAAANKERYLELISLAKEGKFTEIENTHPGDWIRMHKTFKQFFHDAKATKTPLDELQHIWVTGSTGCGKTKSVMEVFGCDNVYVKDANNRWWDMYNYEDYVLLDDFQKDWKEKACLKNWADHYPFNAEVKGGVMRIRPRVMVVTSNYLIDEAGFQPDDIRPMQRRFTQIEIHNGDCTAFIEALNKVK